MIPWLMENALVATLLAGVVALVCKVVRPRASVRHALWLVVLLKLVTPPVFEWPWSLSVPDAPAVAMARVDGTPGAPAEASPLERAPLERDSAKQGPVEPGAAAPPRGGARAQWTRVVAAPRGARRRTREHATPPTGAVRKRLSRRP
jgi:hypothetical protein